MSKKKSKSHENKALYIIVLVTAGLELVKSIIEIIQNLIE